MASDTSIILRWFYRESFPGGILRFDDILHQAVMLALGKSEIETEQYVYRSRARLWNELLKSLDEDSKMGRTPIFKITDSYSRYLKFIPSNVGSCLTGKEKLTMIRLSSRPFILQEIDQFSNREYEALGCVISKLIGATNVLLTPSGNERGIDFLATVNFYGKCHLFHGSHKTYRIVGQAKKYGSRVELEEIQRLTETLNEIKYQSSEILHLIPPWFRTASGPIIGWIMAHNGVQSGGISYARNHGLILSNSVDLSEIASLSRNLDDTLYPEKRARELHALVNSMLSDPQYSVS